MKSFKVYFILFEIQYFEVAANIGVKPHYSNFTKSLNKGNCEGIHFPRKPVEKKPENCVETNIFTGIFQGFCQVDYLTHILSFAKHHCLKRNYFCLKEMLKIRICTTISNPVNKLD